ncbi:MAG: EAL domain-containing protein [Phycisphaeraceae bacterium]
MSPLLLNIGLATSLGMIVILGATYASISRRGWHFVSLGVGLLMFGTVLHFADRAGYLGAVGVMGDPAVKAFLKEFIGVLGGFSFLTTGLVSWLITLARRDRSRGDRSRHLDHPPAMSENELRDSQDLVNSILESSLSGVLVLKAIRDQTRQIIDFDCQLVNAAGEQLLRRSGAELVGKRLNDHLPCLKTEGWFDDAVSVIESDLPLKDDRFCANDGRWYQIAAVKLGDGLAVTFADISDQKRSEEQLRHAALHDALTGLPNRTAFIEHLEQAIHRATRFADYKFAVLFLDFDRFKIINDSLGHDVGDQLLISIAEQLRAQLRAVDTASRLGGGHLPARLGGDEFVVLLDGIQDVRDAVAVAERLQKEFSVPHTIAGHQVFATVSIGIVTSDGGYHRPDELLRDADTAMYEAKTAGRARYVIFDERMHRAVVERLMLEKDLRDAIDQQAFELRYEPIVSFETGRLVGFEALVRWPHPNRGDISPGVFIEVAEELGLIGPIGQWVLEQACRQLKTWQDRFPADPPLFVGVNLSKHQLFDPKLITTIQGIIEQTGLAPQSLRLEITENMVMGDLEQISAVLGRLRQLGVQLVMDDFGTGHSSLNCLHRFPLQVLKIDRSFIKNVEKKKKHYVTIIHAIMELAHNLDMQVIAEGVENEDQLTLLRGLGCQYGQGWLFSKPVSAEEAQRFLRQNYRFDLAA